MADGNEDIASASADRITKRRGHGTAVGKLPVDHYKIGGDRLTGIVVQGGDVLARNRTWQAAVTPSPNVAFAGRG